MNQESRYLLQSFYSLPPLRQVAISKIRYVVGGIRLAYTEYLVTAQEGKRKDEADRNSWNRKKGEWGMLLHSIILFPLLCVIYYLPL